MKFDFYLSEMSVSNQHGGGLTLQRILGSEINDIDHFIHVNRFAADLPAKGDLLARTTDLLSIWESELFRKVLGRTLAARLAKKRLMVKWHATGAAKKIGRIFKDKQEITGLICPQGANAIFTLEALKKVKKVTYITWVMDDHLVGYAQENWQYPAGMEAVFAKHLREAAHVFVISPAMQQFYQERFGIQSTVLFGSADQLDTGTSKVLAGNQKLMIGYFGAVAAWQKDALKATADALKGTETQLDIYSGIDQLPPELVLDQVCFKGRLKPEDVPARMRNYNAVLLPISFQQNIRNMSQFNIATKMSEYLASGVPILAVGPPYAAMIAYLADKDAAITVTAVDETAIRNAFDGLRDRQRVAVILQNARRTVEREVGSKPMGAVWQNVTKGLHHLINFLDN